MLSRHTQLTIIGAGHTVTLQGQMVFEKVIEVETSGIINEEISRAIFPSSGLYIIKAGETLYLTKKIVIE